MPKYELDFDLDLWIRNLQIEADSPEEAKEKLCSMSISDIIDEGYVKDYKISTIDIYLSSDDEEEE